MTQQALPLPPTGPERCPEPGCAVERSAHGLLHWSLARGHWFDEATLLDIHPPGCDCGMAWCPRRDLSKTAGVGMAPAPVR